MEELSISEQLLYTTIRIECTLKDGGQCTGTGFFFEVEDQKGIIPTLITNKHVVKDASKVCLIFCIRNENDNPDDQKHFSVTIDEFEKSWVLHPDPKVDLCIMPIGPILNQVNKDYGINLYYRTFCEKDLPNAALFDEITALEDIVMIGYPNGIWDKKNNKPVFRKGITATDIKFDYNGEKEFLIDAACFPGSSGSPVVLLNKGMYMDRKGNVHTGCIRMALLGVLYAGPQYRATGDIRTIDIPTAEKNIVVSSIPNNLGYVIKSERIQELEEELEKRIKMQRLNQQ